MKWQDLRKTGGSTAESTDLTIDKSRNLSDTSYTSDRASLTLPRQSTSVFQARTVGNVPT
jgi:hypothetical protein